ANANQGVFQNDLWLNLGTQFLRVGEVDWRMYDGRIVDVDGDGLSDVLYVGCPIQGGDSSYTHPTVFYSNGNGTFRQRLLDDVPAGVALDRPPTQSCLNVVLDMDGDGMPDIIQAEPGQDNLQIYHNTRGHPDRLIEITDGIGKQIDVSYGVSVSDTE